MERSLLRLHLINSPRRELSFNLLDSPRELSFSLSFLIGTPIFLLIQFWSWKRARNAYLGRETMGLGMEWKPKPVNPSLVRSTRAAATPEIPSISTASSTKTQPISALLWFQRSKHVCACCIHSYITLANV